MQSRPTKLSDGNVRAIAAIAEMRKRFSCLQQNDADREREAKELRLKKIRVAQAKALSEFDPKRITYSENIRPETQILLGLWANLKEKICD